RKPADGRTGGSLTDDEVEVTLTVERPAVAKETVATENVKLGKRAVTDTETVQTDLAHAEVEVDGTVTDETREPRRDRSPHRTGTTDGRVTSGWRARPRPRRRRSPARAGEGRDLRPSPAERDGLRSRGESRCEPAPPDPRRSREHCPV